MMEPYNKQQEKLTKTSPLLIHSEKQPLSSSLQDTNYIGITINDDTPKPPPCPPPLTRHASLNDYATKPKRDSVSLTTDTLSSPIYNHHSRFEDVITGKDGYLVEPEKSGAFLKINHPTDLPMSHHQRMREGKRYGVNKKVNLCSHFFFADTSVSF